MSAELLEGLTIAAVGLVSVFVVLTAITLIVGRMRWLDGVLEARAAQRALVSSPEPPKQNIDDITLVLISAAVATVLQGRYHIRAIRRLPRQPGKGSWSQQGRAELQGSHVIARKPRGRSK